MRHLLFSLLMMMGLLAHGQSSEPGGCVVCDSIAERQLRQLSLEEKLSLMQHRNPAIPRMGLAAYSWWNEALHGVGRNGKATVYPMPIALAATWDTALLGSVYRQIAAEARLKFYEARQAGGTEDYQGLTFFTPNINLFRDPRWGRGMETFGEDPWLTAQMGLAAVNGLQHRIATPQGSRYASLACLKHLAVHSGPEGLRHQFDAKVSERDLWTTYLAAFDYIIRHGDVQQVMCAYNRLNGVPCCTNEALLVDVLRNEWKYNGLMVTDCWALNDTRERDTVIPRHETYPTAARAAQAAFGSEVDLECGSGLPALQAAVDSGYIDTSAIDAHVRRILLARCRVGVDEAAETQSPYLLDGDSLALRAAQESIVLLKNQGNLLPLAPERYGNVALLGPNIDDSVMALGNYNGDPHRLITIRQAFERRFEGDTLRKIYCHTLCPWVDSVGQHTELPQDEGFGQHLAQSDVIVFVGGLSPALEGEELQVELPGFHRGDRTCIELPEVQVRMLQELKQRTGKPIVLALCTGSAIALQEVEPYVDAIVVAWYGGQQMGEAVFRALTDSNASFGRLPVTFYSSTSQLPPFEDYAMQGRTYRYLTEQPLYPFGYGLNYNASRSLEGVAYNPATHSVEGTLRVQGRAENEVVQLYLRNLDDPKGPRRQLVGFFRPQRSREKFARAETGVPFSIPIAEESFRIYDETQQRMVMARSGTAYELEVVCANQKVILHIQK